MDKNLKCPLAHVERPNTNCQYIIIHHTLPYINLDVLKANQKKNCNYWTSKVEVQHFLPTCDKANTLGTYGFK